MSRFNDETTDLVFHDDLGVFIPETAKGWMRGGLIKANSWKTVVLLASRPGSDFTDSERFDYGETMDGAEHGQGWYEDNVDGKNLICLETKMDSHEAIRLWPGLVAHLDGAFPWEGAIIDPVYGLIIGTSGFKGDEDLLFSRTVRNRIAMLLDRLGDTVLGDARVRGEQLGEAGADRFTRRSSGLLVPAA